MTQERQRLADDRTHRVYWRRWGPYLAERQWGTVREDYSADGDAWRSFPFEHAHLRAYRWGEDGLLGFCDNHARVCLAPSLWNERDPILKERLFGLSGPQGNHGEDVKELYYYEDALPSHAYNRAVYKYPQGEFPYATLQAENARRGLQDDEYELLDTGVFDQDRYFDLIVEYAKGGPDDVLARFTVVNRGTEPAPVQLIPQIWFRNTWSFGGDVTKPELVARRPPDDEGVAIALEHPELPGYVLTAPTPDHLLFTENESNTEALYGVPNASPYVKDAFHRFVVHGEEAAVNPAQRGTKAGLVYRRVLGPGEQFSVSLRLSARVGAGFDSVLKSTRQEADDFYQHLAPAILDADSKHVQRSAFAGLLWSKQAYYYVVDRWLDGDPRPPRPPAARQGGRNASWRHLFVDDVLSMPDKWEFPWFASWDLAFHCVPLAVIDPDFAKRQLTVLTREWYMHPNGQVPAYEWNFSDVNPPVLAWAAWRVYGIHRRETGTGDTLFLERVFQKLLLNFTWWVNRKDALGNNVFEGGFLGLDNIGLFDRSAPLPGGGSLEQSDGTSWMAMYALNMLKIAIELAKVKPAYEDIASKFFEHFVTIANAVQEYGGGKKSLFNYGDGFFYDQIRFPDGSYRSLKIRSLVGLVPLFANDTIEADDFAALPNFRRRTEWFLKNRPEKTSAVLHDQKDGRYLLSLVTKEQLPRILARMLDERQFYSAHGIRSLSKEHESSPYEIELGGAAHRVEYSPGESRTALFGGNSNWRGPVWLPMNFLIIESLQKYHHYFGSEIQVECPTGSGRVLDLWNVAASIARRLIRIFRRDPATGLRPAFGRYAKLQHDPQFCDRLLFHEYFHGDDGSGRGASHQTGWTGIVAKLLQQAGEYETIEPPHEGESS